MIKKYDILGLSILYIVIGAFFHDFFNEGNIVFSDLSFGISSDRYMDQVFGLWNTQFSSATFFNIPRLFYVLPFWIFSLFFKNSGSVLIKSLILGIIYISGTSMYFLIRKLINVYFEEETNYLSAIVFSIGGLFYSLNPWVIIRIQHVFLLCGYSLFPLLILIFFNIFDPKFQLKSKIFYKKNDFEISYFNIINIFIFGIIFSINSAAIHYFFYEIIFFSMIGGLLFIKYTIKFRKYKKVKIFIKNFFLKSFLVSTSAFIFSFYWLGIYIFSILLKTQVSQNNINAIETFGMFSKYSSLRNVVYMTSYWWPMINLEELPNYFYVGGGILFAFMLYGITSRGYKDNMILFLTVTSVVFLILATGVKYKYIENIFILITKFPVFGNIFRDPNKFVGIAAVGMSIILSFGLRSFFNRKVIKLKDALLESFVISGVFISLGLYLYPYHSIYVNEFYSPVKVPEEYYILQDITRREKEKEKIFYLPIADSMNYSYTGFATPYWNTTPSNKPKATGDFQVYSSNKNTIFHYEGNIENMLSYILYIQHLLDWGYSERIGDILKILPISLLTYHKEYYGQEERQEFNLKLLKHQENLEERFSDRIFTTFKLKEKGEYLSLITKKILTPYGLSKLDSYSTYENFDFNKYGVLFTNSQRYNEDFFSLKDDYIEVSDMKDLYLSTLPEKYHIIPFRHIKTADVFLNWGKVSLKNEDWKWYLKINEIENFKHELDKEFGVVATLTYSRLNFPTYDIEKYPGKKVYDLSTLLKKDIFFKADNPNIVSIQGYPRSNVNIIPVVTSKILDGDPNNVWQIAKSGFLEAKENVLYNFNLIISGQGVDRLHLKVRFYDENKKELAMTYVSAPNNEFLYTEMNFTGRYVSPPRTKYMRVDILSFENIKQKSYWWIHDFIVESYEDYMEENVLEIKKTIENPGKYKLYGRFFKSSGGGILKIIFDEKEILVNTKTISNNGFFWVDLGEFELEKKEYNLQVKSLEGFNSINYFTLIEEQEEKQWLDKIEGLLKDNNLFIQLEAESDFDYVGNIQTLRSYPLLSGGKGIRSQRGVLDKNIQILKTGNYNIDLKMEAIPDLNKDIKIEILNSKNESVFTKIIESKDFLNRNEENKVLVDYDIFNQVFQRVYKEKFDILIYYDDYIIKDVFLEKGDYNLKISFNSQIDSVMKFENLHKMNPDEIVIERYQQIPFQEDCSECEIITEDMFRLNYSNNKFRVDYDPTCSCDWYIISSEKVPVKYDEEYLYKLRVRSDTVRKRHMKVYFLDSRNRLLETAFIYEVEEEKKKEWNNYEQIIRVPKNASYMMLQIWARGDKKLPGNLEIEEYEVIPYDAMILVDSINIYEKKFEKISKKNDFSIIFDNPMEKIVYGTSGNPNGFLTYGETPSPLWEDVDGNRLNKYINVVRPYTKVKNFEKMTFAIVLRNYFNIGFILFGLGIVIFILIIGYNKRIDNKKTKK